MNTPISNPNDFKVVEFQNGTDFDFTPEMGCMYDSNPIFGISGEQCIKAGERVTLPYRVGHQLAVNLAKQSLVRNAPPHDPKDINPVGKPLWSDESLESITNSFLTELYTNEKPAVMSETDKLMAEVASLKKLMQDNLPVANQPTQPKADNDHVAEGASQFPALDGLTYKDKAEVIAALTKRGIPFNARDSKAKLEQLLA